MFAILVIPMLMAFAVNSMPPVYDDSGRPIYWGKPDSYRYKQGSDKGNIRLSDVLHALKYGQDKDQFYYGKTDDKFDGQKQDGNGPSVVIITMGDVDSVRESLKQFVPQINEESRFWDLSRNDRDVEKTSMKLADVLQNLRPGDKKVMFYFGDPNDQRFDQTQDGRNHKFIIMTFHSVDADFDTLKKFMPFMNEETRLFDLDTLRDSNRINRDVNTDDRKLSDILFQIKNGDFKTMIYFGKTDEHRGNQWQEDKNKKLIIITMIDVGSDHSVMDPFQKYKDQNGILKEDYDRL